MLYADVKNTAKKNHDKNKVLSKKQEYQLRSQSSNTHAKKCFKDHYPDEDIGLAIPNKYSSLINWSYELSSNNGNLNCQHEFLTNLNTEIVHTCLELLFELDFLQKKILKRDFV